MQHFRTDNRRLSLESDNSDSGRDTNSVTVRSNSNLTVAFLQLICGPDTNSVHLTVGLSIETESVFQYGMSEPPQRPH